MLQGQKETSTANPQSRKKTVTQDKIVAVDWSQNRLDEHVLVKRPE